MPEDRRETDKIILEEVRALQKDVSRIDVNLALNTQETARLAKYQELQNSKMVKMESRTQAVEGATALTSTALAKIQTEKEKEEQKKEQQEEKQGDRQYQTQDRWKWVIVGFMFSFVGQLLFPLIQKAIDKIFTN